MRDEKNYLADILLPLSPNYTPKKSLRHNPSTCQNPQNPDLLQVLLGTLPLAGHPPFPFDFPCVKIRVLNRDKVIPALVLLGILRGRFVLLIAVIFDRPALRLG